MQASPKLLGHLFTTWGVKKERLIEDPPLVEGLKLLRGDTQAINLRSIPELGSLYKN